jgi:hypothetical protein
VSAVLTAVELAPLDAAVEQAIDRGRASGLRVLGFGEISLVIGWPTGDPAVAAKRLPVFGPGTQPAAYAALVARYVGELRGRGVDVVDTEVHVLPAADGAHVYLTQPLVAREDVLTAVLARAGREERTQLLRRLVESIVLAVDDGLGLDAQAGNWAVDGDRLALLDVSTPMLRSADGRQALELPVFLSIYPWALRRALHPVADHVMAQYHDRRTVLLDVASNLHKEELDSCVPLLLAEANAHIRPAITIGETMRYFRRDRALWLAMQRLRRADRAWQRTVRRRRYPFLLAPPYRYGPMTPPPEGSA